MAVTVKVRGPLFDGRAQAAIKAFLDEAKEAIADRGVNLVGDELAGSLQNPTGFYESRIRTERRADDQFVTDSGVVYGPWLEGVSSRNQSTRFKGYRSFRQATQHLNEDAAEVAEGVLRKHLGEMG
jgi:hypothetical protein